MIVTLTYVLIVSYYLKSRAGDFEREFLVLLE